MADKVQLSLEHTLHDLDQLVKQGLFQKTEVRNIVKKRRFYEFRFEKKDVTKQDYFKAIRYEKILDKKRKQRKKEKKIKQSTYFEFTFLRRAVYLFQKMINKFKNSEDVWMEFFYFLIKNQCFNILNKEIGNCLSLFPKNIEFWKIAAYNEHENNCNSITARTLFQKCIRINKDNIDSYLEYFIFELKFVEKLVMREKILKGEEQKLRFVDDVGNEQEKEENKKKFQEMEVTDEVLALRIPEVVWRNALENFKNGPSARLTDITFKFLESLMANGKNLNILNLKKQMKDFIIAGSDKDVLCNKKIKLANLSIIQKSNDQIVPKTLEKYNKLFKNFFEEQKNIIQISGSLVGFYNSYLKQRLDLDEAETVKYLIIKAILHELKSVDFASFPQMEELIILIKFMLNGGMVVLNELKDHSFNLNDKLVHIVRDLGLTNKSKDLFKRYLVLLYENFSEKLNDPFLIADKIIEVFSGHRLNSQTIIDLISSLFEGYKNDPNRTEHHNFVKLIERAIVIYKKSSNRTISSNRELVQALTKFALLLSNGEPSEEVLKILSQLSREYLIDFEGIFTLAKAQAQNPKPLDILSRQE